MRKRCARELLSIFLLMLLSCACADKTEETMAEETVAEGAAEKNVAK